MARRLAILGALAGCYGSGVVGGDATRVPDAAERGTVRVKVSGFVEKTGLHVYFQERDSTLSLATRTDANGEATGRLGPDGFVTLVAGYEPTLTLWTYAGVQPGDELEFFEPDVVDVETPVDSISVFAEGVGAPPFTLRSSCGGAQTIFDALPVAMAVTICAPRIDFLFELGQVYRYARDVDVTQRRVDFTGPFIDYGVSTVTVSGAPGGIGAVQQALLGQGLPLETTSTVAEIVNGGFAAGLGLPLPPDGTLLTQVDVLDDPIAQHLVDWRPAATEVSFAYDEVVVARATEAPRYDASTTSIVWSEGSGSPGDLVRATLHWLDGMHARTRLWVIIAPRGGEPVVHVPRLPVPDLVPTIEAPQTMESFIVGEQRDWLRQHMHGRWLAQGVAWPATGATGRAVWRSL